MDSFARADLFVWKQTEVAFMCLPAGPQLSPSMACHSEDKHQLAAHSTDTTTSSQSQQITFQKLTACYHFGQQEGLIFCSFLAGGGLRSHQLRPLNPLTSLLVPSAVTHMVNRPLSPPVFSFFSKSACTLQRDYSDGSLSSAQ